MKHSTYTSTVGFRSETKLRHLFPYIGKINPQPKTNDFTYEGKQIQKKVLN